MVLRKPPPPRLENLNKWHARSESISPTSSSTHSPSSQRRTRPHRVPSQDSVYSPDLNTSPAFDLMSLEQAQRSPVGSPTSHPPNSWSGSLADNPATRDGAHSAGSEAKGHGLPPALTPGPQGPSEDFGWQPTSRDRSRTTGEIPMQLQSNNPFVNSRTSSGNPNQWTDRHSHATTNSDPLSQTEGYIPMTARLSLLDSEQEASPWTEHDLTRSDYQRPLADPQPYDPSPWADHNTSQAQHPPSATNPFSSEPSPWESQQSIKVSAPQEIYLQGGQSNPYNHAPAVVVQPSDDAQGTSGLQPPYRNDRLASDTSIRTPSAFSSATSATSHELIDLDPPSSTLATQNGPARPTSSLYSSEGADKGGANLQSPLPPAPGSGLQSPASDPRSLAHRVAAQKLSPAEAARQQEQRAETYTIRQINRSDRNGNLVQSPILIQNKNGPCPLLALINALVLRAEPNTQPPIIKALRTREQISLGLLIEALFDELTTCLGPHQEFPDIEALTQFLTMLHTGMNVNPRLTLTPDIQLYSTFGIPLIHGWVASWSDPAHSAMTRVGQYHEDIQLLHFHKQELEDRVMQGQSLSPDEEQKMADIQAIQQFVDVENATQLSPFGLTQLSTRLAPGSISILFRNDHFSTLYKHPESHQLYTLVTDAGYANHAEVVWESLVDVTGFNAEFLAGDFRAVGHGPSGSGGPADNTGPRTSGLVVNDELPAGEGSQSPFSSQEQSDADYAYALSLQFQEEEQRERQGTQQTQQQQGQQGNGPRASSHARHTSGPSRTSSSAHTPNGSSPRISSPRISGPNRTSSVATGLRQPHTEPDPDDPNAPPPPYEQAASGPRYSPPERRNRYSDFPVDANGTYSPRYPQNRYSNRPTADRYGADRNRNKDCIVM